MEWIKTGGGPLICIENKLAGLWGGMQAKSRIDESLPNGKQSDYDRVCLLKNYLDAIDVNNHKALIIGDMPLETAVWKDSQNRATIIRVFYSDPDADILRMVSLFDEKAFDNPIECIEFTATSSGIVIFDAAYSGENKRKKEIMFELVPGKYKVLTQITNPDEKTSLLLHKFTLIM